MNYIKNKELGKEKNMAYYPVILPSTSGQGLFYETEHYPIEAIEYELGMNYIEAVKSDGWLYMQTEEGKCGAFKINVWYKSDNTSTFNKPACSIMLYRRRIGLFKPSSEMEFIQEYIINWEIEQPTDQEGISAFCRGTTLINLMYAEGAGDDNLYYMQYLDNNFPVESYFHSINGNLDAANIYQAGIWVKETPDKYYNYITNTPDVRGIINYVMYLDRTLVGDFVTTIGLILGTIKTAKQEPSISKKDIVVTVISAILVTGGGLDFVSGIAVSLMITGLANSNNAIDKPHESFLEHIFKFLDTDGYASKEVAEETGATYLNSHVGLKIIVSKRISTYKVQNTNLNYMNENESGQGTLMFDQDTSTVEVWDKGNAGKDILKPIEGPQFYKGYWMTDLQLFKEGTPSLANDTIEDIFGYGEYLNKAREKKNEQN